MPNSLLVVGSPTKVTLNNWLYCEVTKMCMKNLNINTCCYKNVTMQNETVLSFDRPITGVVFDKTLDGKLIADSFFVETKINILGTNNEDHKADNLLEQRKSLDFIIRLTKRDKDPEKQIYKDLDTFTIHLSQMESAIEQACFPFFNYTRVTRVKDLELDGGAGSYILKVLVRESGTSDKMIIQSMNIITMFASN